jgi:hypothetical protein
MRSGGEWRYGVLSIILESAAVERLDDLNDQIGIRGDTRDLALEVLDDARPRWLRKDIGIVAAIAKARGQRAQRKVDKLLDLVKPGLVQGRVHSRAHRRSHTQQTGEG